MFLSQFVFRAQYGSWFADIAFNSIDLDMRLGFNAPDSNWALLCVACPVVETIIVKYDGSGYQNYTVLEGTNDPLFGNPLPSGKSAYNVGINTTRNVTRVNLPTVSLVTDVSLSAWSNQTSQTSTVFIEYYDINDQIISSSIEFRTEKSTWFSSSFDSVGVANVAYLIFYIAKHASPHILYQDNLTITYEA
jgi:hypothetical protein